MLLKTLATIVFKKAFLDAALAGDARKVEALLDKGVDPNVEDHLGEGAQADATRVREAARSGVSPALRRAETRKIMLEMIYVEGICYGKHWSLQNEFRQTQGGEDS